jgi:hypothetical protein
VQIIDSSRLLLLSAPKVRKIRFEYKQARSIPGFKCRETALQNIFRDLSTARHQFLEPDLKTPPRGILRSLIRRKSESWHGGTKPGAWGILELYCRPCIGEVTIHEKARNENLMVAVPKVAMA